MGACAAGALNDRLRAVRKRVRVAGGVPGGRRGSALPPSGAHGVKRCPRRSRRFRAPSSLVQLGRSCGIAVTPAPCGGRGWLWVLRFAKARWSSGLAEARGNPPVVRSSPVGRRLGGGKDGDFSKTQYVLRIARGRKPPLKAHFQPSVRPESASSCPKRQEKPAHPGRLSEGNCR